jgi:2-phospho-L-lactate guanylyltransferase
MSNRILVAMPMKPFIEAKSRLANTLPQPQRERLARSLFLSTQRFFASEFPQFDRLVVTSSSEVQGECWRVGARCLLESSVAGLNVAAARAVDWACMQGYDKLLLIPGDVPVWMRGEVRALFDAGREHDVVIARARDGGTNALLLRLPTPFEFRYGPDSAAGHLHVAQTAGLSVITYQLPFLAHDIDVPADCLLPLTSTFVTGVHR